MVVPPFHAPPFTHALAEGSAHRKRIKKTEEKAIDVAAVWGTEFIQFLAAPATLQHRMILKHMVNSSFYSNCPNAKQLVLQGID